MQIRRRTETDSGVWVDDVHARINRTRVARVLAPASAEETAELVRRARANGTALCVAGARHAMGGQQFARGADLLDLAKLATVGALDWQAGTLEVGAGARWPHLISALIERQGSRAGAWTIAQKQSGADRLTLGGALGSNVHGRGLRMAPFAADVESFEMVDARGEILRCSREHERDLFELALGGYGLFGIVTSLRLRLTRRRKLLRRVELRRVDEAVPALEGHAARGALYGDFQFAVDRDSPAFLRDGVLSCYHPAPDDAAIPPRQLALGESDWRRLVRMAHFEPTRAFDQYVEHYLATDGQLYWSDLHQLGTYVDDYHADIDERAPGSEVITELYVPRERLPELFDALRVQLRELGAQVIYGTLRLIERDRDSFLAWAREPWACTVLNLHVEHSPQGLERAARAFRASIDVALGLGGSYYLTYHRWATREQALACHPRLERFVALKRAHDPRATFTSEWYRHLARWFA